MFSMLSPWGTQMFNILVWVLSPVSICLIYCDHPCSGPPIITTCHPGSALWQQYYVKCDAASEKLIQTAKIKSMHFHGISSLDIFIWMCSKYCLQYTYSILAQKVVLATLVCLVISVRSGLIKVSYSFIQTQSSQSILELKHFNFYLIRQNNSYFSVESCFAISSSPHQPVLFILSELFFLFYFSNWKFCPPLGKLIWDCPSSLTQWLPRPRFSTRHYTFPAKI